MHGRIGERLDLEPAEELIFGLDAVCAYGAAHGIEKCLSGERTKPSSGARRSRESTTMLTDFLTPDLHVRRGHQRRRARMKASLIASNEDTQRRGLTDIQRGLLPSSPAPGPRTNRSQSSRRRARSPRAMNSSMPMRGCAHAPGSSYSRSSRAGGSNAAKYRQRGHWCGMYGQLKVAPPGEAGRRMLLVSDEARSDRGLGR